MFLCSIWLLAGLTTYLVRHCYGLTLSPCGTDNTLEVVENKGDNLFTCSGLNADETVKWNLLDTSQGDENAGTCAVSPYSNYTCTATIPQVFTPGRVEVTTSTMTVKATNSRFNSFFQGTSILCKATKDNVDIASTTCRLDHIAKPTSSTCEILVNTSVVNSRWTLTANCTVTGVYSYLDRYTCQLVQTKPSVSNLSSTVSMTVTQSPNTKYKTGMCDVTVPFADTSATYRYNMVITPGRVDVVASFEGSNNFQISRPGSSPPSHNCPQYVGETRDVSCTCSATDLGQPAGVVRWKGFPSNQLSLSNVNMNQNGARFVCEVMWNGRRMQSVVYTLRVVRLTLSPCGTDNTLEVVENKRDNLFTCSGLNADLTVQWTMQTTSQEDINAGYCAESPPYSCSIPIPQVLTPGRVEASASTMTVEATNTRFNIFFQGTSIQCKAAKDNNDIASTTCRLDHIAKPSSSACNILVNASTISSRWTLTANCTVTRVYSYLDRYTCQLVQTIPGVSNSSSTVVMNLVPSSNTKYKNGMCDVTVPFPDNSATYSYKMVVTPGRVDVVATFEGRYSFQIRRPGSTPSHTCPQYTIETRDVSCTCAATDLGQPAGVVRWRGFPSNQLSLSNVNKKQHGTQFVCEVMWNGGRVQSVVYILQLACKPEVLDNGLGDDGIMETPSVNFVTEAVLLNFHFAAYPTPQLTDIKFFPQRPNTTSVGQQVKGNTIQVACSRHTEDLFKVTCAVTVDNITSLDAGFYQAVIGNSLGDVMVLFQVTVNATIPRPSSQFPVAVTAAGTAIGVSVFGGIALFLIWWRRRKGTRQEERSLSAVLPPLSVHQEENQNGNLNEMQETNSQLQSVYEHLQQQDIGVRSDYADLTPNVNAGLNPASEKETNSQLQNVYEHLQQQDIGVRSDYADLTPSVNAGLNPASEKGYDYANAQPSEGTVYENVAGQSLT